MLRVVEVHRTAEGGWELVEGPPKPLQTFDTGGPAAAVAAAAAPTFLPLAALFAECLQQDSQMNAAFEREYWRSRAGSWSLRDDCWQKGG